MSDMSTPRLIEVDFALRRVSEESVREKNIRHGHISTLHIWWARRPLAASRATALAALLSDDPPRREELLWLVAADSGGMSAGSDCRRVLLSGRPSLGRR